MPEFFKPGNPGKPKGAKNKITQEARTLFLQTVENQMPHIAEAFEQLRVNNPAKYLEVFEKYVQYFIPKKVDLTSEEEKIQVSLAQITTDQLNEFISRLDKAGDSPGTEEGEGA